MFRALPASYLATVLMLACLVLLMAPARACMVCIPFPEQTATDRLLHAEVVVLARENEHKPFSYLARQVLKGDLKDPAIDLFIDSVTRRRLAADPDLSVVLAFNRELGSWRSLGHATAGYRALVQEILAREPTWLRPGGAQRRAEFFTAYLAHADSNVSELAYLEVGQASYRTIRQADPLVSAGQVHRFLDNPQYIEWHALYILLLGVDATPAEKDRIRATMARAARFEYMQNLSAWATALIEIDGAAAIEQLEADYLGRPGRDPDTVLEIVKALSVHGADGRPVLRHRIAKSYRSLIDTYPTLAGWAVRDLTAWSDWRFAEILIELRNSEMQMDSATAYAIDYYIGRSQLQLARTRANLNPDSNGTADTLDRDL